MELHELFEAYYECRRNKRATYNALKFEMDYESHLVQLFQDIQDRAYRIGKSIAFIVDRPVKREIFAGDFRDRIVHHYVIGKLGPILEKLFIHDSYSCRKGKWTLFGISRMAGFLRSATQNHAVDAHVLKLDISGFFMGISHDVLLSQIRGILDAKYPYPDREELYWLCDMVIRNDPTKNCAIKGSRSDWVWLPKSKSLFFAKPGTGLPIGNLTSQIFANLYLHDLDVFVKKELGFRYYGRYVDDFVLVDAEPERLRKAVIRIRAFLSGHLRLELHPKKIYLQHYAKGLPFLGSYIMPNAIYVGRKTKTNFYRMIEDINAAMDADPRVFRDAEKRHKALSWLNSYLGLMRHHDTFRIRKKLLLSLRAAFWNDFYISEKYRVVVEKTREG